VRDLARTIAWYRDALGLEPRTLDGHDGPFALAKAGAVELVFIPRHEPAGRTPIVVFGLESGIYEVVESLAARGVEIVMPVSETPDGGLSADFRDPDGHILSVYQPGDAST
jgi:predicted enzyme related to lactoylglutathione lyase